MRNHHVLFRLRKSWSNLTDPFSEHTRQKLGWPDVFWPGPRALWRQGSLWKGQSLSNKEINRSLTRSWWGSTWGSQVIKCDMTVFSPRKTSTTSSPHTRRFNGRQDLTTIPTDDRYPLTACGDFDYKVKVTEERDVHPFRNKVGHEQT